MSKSNQLPSKKSVHQINQIITTILNTHATELLIDIQDFHKKIAHLLKNDQFHLIDSDIQYQSLIMALISLILCPQYEQQLTSDQQINQERQFVEKLQDVITKKEKRIQILTKQLQNSYDDISKIQQRMQILQIKLQKGEKRIKDLQQELDEVYKYKQHDLNKQLSLALQEQSEIKNKVSYGSSFGSKKTIEQRQSMAQSLKLILDEKKSSRFLKQVGQNSYEQFSRMLLMQALTIEGIIDS